MHILRLPKLCESICLLSEAGNFDEAATLVRVMAELSITIAWIGTDDDRGRALAQDAENAENKGDTDRKKYFGLGPSKQVLTDAKPLPPCRTRAEQAGPNSMMLFAGVYQWGSSPTHSAFCAARHLDDQAYAAYGRRFAAVAVQAAKFLAVDASRTLQITAGHSNLAAALAEWTGAR